VKGVKKKERKNRCCGVENISLILINQREKTIGFLRGPSTNVWWMRPFGIFNTSPQHYLFAMHGVQIETKIKK